MSKNEGENHINVNRILESIDKVNKVLWQVRMNGNVASEQTWERILAKLKFKLMDANVEMESKGRYNYQ